MFLHRFNKVRAPEFPTGLQWLNGDEQSLKDLRGCVVLLDFWTYSCVNCLRTLPHVNQWHERYTDKGLTIIGIHTPEFAFEKDVKRVKEAVKRYNISYPVVLDNGYDIWRAYSNRWWPRKFLLDHTGGIIYDHIGEGGYAQTEQMIQRALTQIGAEDLPIIEPEQAIGGGVCYRTTPETYLGYMRGSIANAAARTEPGEEMVFTDIDDQRDVDAVYLHGHFSITEHAIRHTRSTSAATEYLAMKYSAFSVNLVMGSEKTVPVEIELDGHPLPEDMHGEDVVVNAQGRAIVKVKDHRMYRLIDADTYHRGTLKLKMAGEGIEMYAFTFGGCKGM